MEDLPEDLVKEGITLVMKELIPSGIKMVGSYFKDHRPLALKKAKENAISFFSKLNMSFKQIAAPKDKKENIQIKENISSPYFSALFDQATITASLTDEDIKHAMLANLVSETLKSNLQSNLSLTTMHAITAVRSLSARHLKLIALNFILRDALPTGTFPKDLSKVEYNNMVVSWLTERTKGLLDEVYEDLDLMHLESNSCVQIMRIGETNLEQLLKNKFDKVNLKFDYGTLMKTGIYKNIADIWNNTALRKAHLTSVGILIGAQVYKDMSKQTVTLSSDWYR